MVTQVFVYALLTALATGLGAVPFAFAKKFSKRWLGFANAVAAGLMLAASFSLIYEGLPLSAPRTLVGIVAGLVFILLSHRWIESRGGINWGEMTRIDAKKALMIVLVMTAHSFAEGVGVGVSFGAGEAFGAFISLAIAVHNIPEGLAISLVLVPRGVHWIKAAGWSVFSSLPQPLMAVPAFLFVEVFEPFLPFGLGFAAGAMIWLVFSEILTEALEESPSELVASTITIAIVGMLAFQLFIAP